MTDSSYTAVCLVVDRSGSMNKIREDAEGAINAFLESQRSSVKGRLTVRLVTFDDWYELVCPSTDIRLVHPFSLAPRGNTALHDAMGRGIVEFGAELAALPEKSRPGTVVFAVMTDGLENSSKEYNAQGVRELVMLQQSVFNWSVVYLGANQDAVAEGAKYGVPAGSSLSYSASGAGAQSALRSFTSYVDASPQGGTSVFSAEDREAALGESTE